MDRPRRPAAVVASQMLNTINFEDSGDDMESDFDDAPNYLPSVELINSSDESANEESTEVIEEMSTNAQSTNRTAATPSPFTGKDGTKWERVDGRLPVRGRLQTQNVLRHPPGPKPFVRSRVTNILSSWYEYIDNRIIDRILTYSNSREDCTTQITKEDLLNFIALQYLRGLYNKNLPIRFLWNKNYGIEKFQRTMSRQKFEYISKMLRFDNKNSRSSRLNNDKFAAVREIFDMFMNNCHQKYTPDYSLTVDEELMPLKTRCRFITFMSNKPDKYGIKFWDLVEVKSKYLVSCIPYLGKDASSHDIPLSQRVVTNLVDHLGSGYNVTGDNFFSSVALVEDLQRKSISYVGTIRENRRELCPDMKIDQPLYHSRFYQNEKKTTLSVAYKCKPRKTVYLLSSMHKDAEIDDNHDKLKPQIVLFYNSSKVGVDCVDQMIRLYSTRSASRRWTFAVWCNILDKACINAWVVYKQISGESISRRNFIFTLIEEIFEISTANRYVYSISQPQHDYSHSLSPSVVLKKRAHCGSQGCNNLGNIHCSKCSKVKCGKCLQSVEKYTIAVCFCCNEQSS